MGSRFSNLKWLLVLAGAVGVSPSVQAQAAKVAGQPISFSSPANSDAPSDVSLVPKSPDLSGLPDELRVPASLNSDANSTPPSFVPARISPAQVDRLKTMLDDRNNWALMTPEQILGVDTQKKNLLTSGRAAAGQEQKLSAVDRYNQRQNQEQTAKVNGYDNKSGDQNRQTDAGAPDFVSGRFGNSWQILNQPPVIAPDNGLLGSQNEDSSLSKLFGSSQQASVPDPAQLAAMDRFKQLLQPSPPPATLTSPSSGDPNSSSAFGSRDYHFGQSPQNPSAATYTPLSSGIGTASGLTALGAVQNNWKPAAPPAWAPKPAPWLSKAPPQDFVVPKQKF